MCVSGFILLPESFPFLLNLFFPFEWPESLSFMFEVFLQNQVLMPKSSPFILNPKIQNLTVGCSQALLASWESKPAATWWWIGPFRVGPEVILGSSRAKPLPSFLQNLHSDAVTTQSAAARTFQWESPSSNWLLVPSVFWGNAQSPWGLRISEGKKLSTLFKQVAEEGEGSRLLSNWLAFVSQRTRSNRTSAFLEFCWGRFSWPWSVPQARLAITSPSALHLPKQNRHASSAQLLCQSAWLHEFILEIPPSEVCVHWSSGKFSNQSSWPLRLIIIIKLPFKEILHFLICLFVFWGRISLSVNPRLAYNHSTYSSGHR